MGWGFGIIISKAEKDRALEALEKAKARPEVIGGVTGKTQRITVMYKGKKMVLA